MSTARSHHATVLSRGVLVRTGRYSIDGIAPLARPYNRRWPPYRSAVRRATAARW